jgi:hypothetical protein
MNDYRIASNEDIDVRVDFVRPESVVQYRLRGEDEWEPTPFQSADVNHLNIGQVLQKIDNYLAGF